MSDKTNYLGSILGQDPHALLALREVPAFHDCSGQLLELLFRYGKVVQLREDEELTRENDFDQWVYFVIKGQLEVFVGSQHVDSIASSLVGERCILGEQRRATLRAAAAGVTALGVDMALLDALRDTGAVAVREPIAVYLELLSIIVGEVMKRIAELEFNLIDFTYKYRAHCRAERLSDVLRDLAQGALRTNRQANFAVYRHLLKHDPVSLSHCTANDGQIVDTVRLYSEVVLSGDHSLLYGVAEAVLAAEESEQAAQRGGASAAPATKQAGRGDRGENYSGFAAHVAAIILDRGKAGAWGEPARHAMAAGIRKSLQPDLADRVDLRGMMTWLIEDYRFTVEDTIDLLMTLLKESCDYTAAVNGRIKAMVNELTQTRFGRELGHATLASLPNAAEYLRLTPVEELIPFFSVNILDVYVVQPYMDRLHAAESGTWDKPGTPGALGRDHLLTTLFE